MQKIGKSSFGVECKHPVTMHTTPLIILSIKQVSVQQHQIYLFFWTKVFSFREMSQGVIKT